MKAGLWLIFAGCASTPGWAAEPPQQEPAPPEADADASPRQLSELVVLERGARPRRVLRRERPAIGTHYTSTTTRSGAITQQSPASKARTEVMPSPTYTFDMTVVAHTEDGGWVEESVISGLDIGAGRRVDRQAVADGEQIADSVAGMTSRMHIAADGRSLGTGTWRAGADSDAAQRELETRFEDAPADYPPSSCPLPDSKVGVGARWQTTQERANPLFTYAQTTTYTLTELTDERIVCTFTIEGSAEPRVIEARPGGLQTRLSQFRASGSGRAELSRSHWFSNRTTVSEQRSTVLTAHAGDQRMEVTLVDELQFEWVRTPTQ